jgi:hypothetical protein
LVLSSFLWWSREINKPPQIVNNIVYNLETHPRAIEPEKCGPRTSTGRFVAAGGLTNRPETPAIFNVMPSSSSSTPQNPGAARSADANPEKATYYQ